MAILNILRPKVKVVTHNGSFHADETFACATLSLWAEKNGKRLQIVRTRDEEEIKKADMVVDVGMRYQPDKNRFDHHQKGGTGEHPNSIPYASFGLVWKKYGEEVCGSKEVAKIIEEKLIMPIDARDNGINISNANKHNVFDHRTHDVICNFNPTWLEDQSAIDERFREALVFAKEILKREIALMGAEVEGAKLVRKTIEKQNESEILVLEKYIDWEREVSKHGNIKFVVYKRREGQDWCVKSPRNDLENYDSGRVKLPESWWSLRDKKLEEISGIKDAVFCANGGWHATTRSKQSALAMAKKALGEI